MDPIVREAARREIKRSLKWSNFCTRMVGIDFYDEDWRSALYWYITAKVLLVVSALTSICLVLGEFAFIINTIMQSPRIEDVVSLIHIWGYALLSVAKLWTIWQKKTVFKQLLNGLEEIWPVPPLNQRDQDIKDRSLASLRLMHFWYFWVNLAGVWSFILTPALMHAYLMLAGHDSEMGSPWRVLYPYDRNAPIVRELTYIWESYAGLCAVWTMVGPDLLFAALASHTGMLLRLLNQRLRSLASAPTAAPTGCRHRQEDHYEEIVDIIKLHQKLIRYCLDIEDQFSLVFLINIVLSSINICCAGFMALLVEPLMSPSNKTFVLASLIQMGILCWYGDDTYELNAEVGDAAYSSGWYRCDPRSRRALHFLMQRSHKPLTFTAMKFKFMDLRTYTSIMTTSYSYFALLNTMYGEKFSDH